METDRGVWPRCQPITSIRNGWDIRRYWRDVRYFDGVVEVSVVELRSRIDLPRRVHKGIAVGISQRRSWLGPSGCQGAGAVRPPSPRQDIKLRPRAMVYGPCQSPPARGWKNEIHCIVFTLLVFRKCDRPGIGVPVDTKGRCTACLLRPGFAADGANQAD